MRINIADYPQVIYVDALIGNDSTGDGTESKPFLTINKATTFATVENTLVYIKEGVYPIPNGLSQTVRTDITITYLAETIEDYKRKVVFDLQNVYLRNPIMTKLNTYIGIIFRRSTAGDVRIWEYFANNASLNFLFDNCVFDKGEITPTVFPIFTGNSGGGVPITRLEYKNCAITPPSLSGVNATTGLYKGTFVNCAIADSNLTATAGNLLSATFDVDYKVTNSTGDFGVYKGDNYWRLVEVRLLLLQNSNYYYHNGLQWNMIDAEVTEEKILLNGMTQVTGTQITEFENLYGQNWNPVRWTNGNPSSNGTLNATPYAQTLTANGNVDISGVESLGFNWSATGGSRVAMSVDSGISYHAFKNGVWVDVTADVSQGMTAAEYSALTWNDFLLLKGDSNLLRHKYYLPDSSIIDDILISANLMGNNILAPSSSYSTSYDTNSKTITIQISKSGSYMVNYLDS